MRIPSGKTDQAIFFVALDSTDLVTRKTGLSAFTVYRSRNGGTATVYTTPTVVELSSANMPGVYALTIDEDTTIAAGSDSEEYCVHITCATMAPVSRTIELYRREVTTGNTIGVASNGHISNVDTLTTYTGNTVQTGDAYARIGAAGAGLTALGDTRIAHLDADVSSRSTFAGGAVASVTGNVGGNVTGSVGSISGITFPTRFSSLAIDVSGDVTFGNTSIATVTNLTNAPTSGDFTAAMKTSLSAATPAVTVSDKTGFALTAAYDPAKTAAQAGDAMTLTGAYDAAKTAASATTAAAIQAKTDNLPAAPADESLIIAATNSLATSIAALPTTTTVNAIKAKTDNLPASPAAVGSAMTLTGTYDAAKTAASQASVDDLPTNAELTTALAGSDDATLAAISALPTTSTVMAADIRKVNGVTVTGNGAGAPWGPA